MTKERADEILKSGNASFGNYRKYMTESEIAEINALWNTMPGHTCFYDAICRIYQGRA